MAKPHISHGTKTTVTAIMKSGAARPSAVIRMTATNSPAMPKISMDFQYFCTVDPTAGAKHEFE
jgi:hypothetical protein